MPGSPKRYLIRPSLARASPNDAEALVQTLSDGLVMRRAAMGVLHAMLDHDLDRAAEVFEGLHRDDQRYAAGTVARRMFQDTPERAIEWIQDLRMDIRGQTIYATAIDLYRHDPAKFKALVDRISDMSARIEAVEHSIVWRWEVKRDPYEALRWAASLGSEEVHAQLVANVFATWLERSPTVAREELFAYPRGPARDRALQAFVGQSLKMFDSDAADLYFDAIDAEPARRETARWLLRHYTETEPDRRRALRYRKILGS